MKGKGKVEREVNGKVGLWGFGGAGRVIGGGEIGCPGGGSEAQAADDADPLCLCGPTSEGGKVRNQPARQADLPSRHLTGNSSSACGVLLESAQGLRLPRP